MSTGASLDALDDVIILGLRVTSTLSLSRPPPSLRAIWSINYHCLSTVVIFVSINFLSPYIGPSQPADVWWSDTMMRLVYVAFITRNAVSNAFKIQDFLQLFYLRKHKKHANLY